MQNQIETIRKFLNLSRSCLLNICARVVQNRHNDLTFIRSYNRTRLGTGIKMNLKLCKNPCGYKIDFEPTRNTRTEIDPVTRMNTSNLSHTFGIF